MRMAGDKLIWFKGRATPVVAAAVHQLQLQLQ